MVVLLLLALCAYDTNELLTNTQFRAEGTQQGVEKEQIHHAKSE